MSQHSSLRETGFGVRHRNVLKRYERIKKLKLAARWNESMPVFGLPKVRSIKVKVRKVKSEAKAETGTLAATPAGPAQPQATPSAPPAKTAPGSRPEAKPKAGK